MFSSFDLTGDTNTSTHLVDLTDLKTAKLQIIQCSSTFAKLNTGWMSVVNAGVRQRLATGRPSAAPCQVLLAYLQASPTVQRTAVSALPRSIENAAKT